MLRLKWKMKQILSHQKLIKLYQQILKYYEICGATGCLDINKLTLDLTGYCGLGVYFFLFFLFDSQIDEKKVKGLVAQSCPTLCNCIHGSPSGSSAHGILQARTQGWVAIFFSRVLCFFFFFNIYLSEIHTGGILIFYRYIVKYSCKYVFQL